MYYVCKFYRGTEVIYAMGTVFNPYSKYLDLACNYKELKEYDRVDVLELENKDDMRIYSTWLVARYKPRLNVLVEVSDTVLSLPEDGFCSYLPEEFVSKYIRKKSS